MADAEGNIDHTRYSGWSKGWALVERTNAYWPGLPAWRSRTSARLYRTEAEAEHRRNQILTWAANAYGTSGGPDMRVVFVDRSKK